MLGMGRNLRVLGALAVATLLVGISANIAGAFDSKMKIGINPRKPTMTDLILVSFKTDRRLKAGFHWQVLLTAQACSNHVGGEKERSHRQRIPKGKKLTFFFDPSQAAINPGEWCPGKAYANVSIEPNSGNHIGTLINVRQFRIY